MNVNEIDDLIKDLAENGTQDFLDQPQNIERARQQQVKLLQLLEERKDNAHQVEITKALLIKNHIFAYLHTSDLHPLHLESVAQLHESKPQFVKDLIGDARISFEEQKEIFKTMLCAEIGAGELEKRHFPMFFQTAAMQVMLNNVSKLRKEMAENFKDDSFLNEGNDRQILPTHDFN